MFRSFKKQGLRGKYLVLALAVTLLGVKAGYTDPTSDTPTEKHAQTSWTENDTLTGDWGGVRPQLEDRGVSIEMGYIADWSFNTHGGINTNHANEYRGLFDLLITIDTEKIGLWKNGTIFIDFQTHHGPDPTERHLGDIQGFTNIDAPDYAQVAEYWYQHVFFDGRLRVKVGKMDANADFAYVDFGGDFSNSSAGFSPTIPLVTFPDPTLGVAVFFEPVDWMYFNAAIYDAIGSGRKWGFSTALHSPDETLTVFELGFRPTLTLRGQKLPGRYAVGGWYHNGTFDIFMNDMGGRRRQRTQRGNAGLYLTFDQMLYRENPEDEEDEQGLGGFFQFGWAPSNCNEITQHYGTGIVYTGLLPSRDDDVIGLMFSHVSLSGRIQSLENRHSETTIELFYKWQVTPFLSLKPDLQYIFNPGGNGPDSLTAGVRAEILF